jgi:Helix-turn-helix domain/RodZ C-terminal domain
VFEIGTSLREARNRQQLDLTDVEQATKIRARYLQALEEEAFEVLPAQTYVKGFLRTYADYLGLDGQLYVDEYNSRYTVGEDEMREPVVARRSSGVQRRHRRLERRGVLIGLAGIAVLCGLVIAAFTFSGNDNPIPNLNTNGAQPQAPPAPARRHTTRHRVAPAKLRFFVVAVHGNCWMDVRNYSSNGKTLFTGTVEPGTGGQFFKARRLWIQFGDPANVKASLNGRLVAIPGGGRPVQVLVTRRGIFQAPGTA